MRQSISRRSGCGMKQARRLGCPPSPFCSAWSPWWSWRPVPVFSRNCPLSHCRGSNRGRVGAHRVGLQGNARQSVRSVGQEGGLSCGSRPGAQGVEPRGVAVEMDAMQRVLRCVHLVTGKCIAWIVAFGYDCSVTAYDGDPAGSEIRMPVGTPKMEFRVLLRV